MMPRRSPLPDRTPATFARFSLLATVVEAPQVRRTARGALARFVVSTHGRPLELLMRFHQPQVLEARLAPVQPGATIHAEGTVLPPRPGRAEPSWFLVERLTLVALSNSHPAPRAHGGDRPLDGRAVERVLRGAPAPTPSGIGSTTALQAGEETT